MSKEPTLLKALSEDEWSVIRQRGMTWKLDAKHQVVLHDGQSSRSRTARTLKLAFDAMGLKVP